MVGIVVASHGNLCVELKKTAEMFTGAIEQCETAPLLPGVSAEEYDKILGRAIEQADSGDGVIVLTDLKGGTPYNRSAGMIFAGKDIRVAAGMNLSMLMSIVFEDRGASADDILEAAINEGGRGIDKIALKK